MVSPQIWLILVRKKIYIEVFIYCIIKDFLHYSLLSCLLQAWNNLPSRLPFQEVYLQFFPGLCTADIFWSQSAQRQQKKQDHDCEWLQIKSFQQCVAPCSCCSCEENLIAPDATWAAAGSSQPSSPGKKLWVWLCPAAPGHGQKLDTVWAGDTVGKIRFILHDRMIWFIVLYFFVRNRPPSWLWDLHFS